MPTALSHDMGARSTQTPMALRHRLPRFRKLLQLGTSSSRASSRTTTPSWWTAPPAPTVLPPRRCPRAGGHGRRLRARGAGGRLTHDGDAGSRRNCMDEGRSRAARHGSGFRSGAREGMRRVVRCAGQHTAAAGQPDHGRLRSPCSRLLSRAWRKRRAAAKRSSPFFGISA
jgi:hypothetical protein